MNKDAAVVKRTARGSDDVVILGRARLAGGAGAAAAGGTAQHLRPCSAEAREALIKELGDPTPHRLA